MVKVIALVTTTVPMEIEVDEKFRPYIETPNDIQLTLEEECEIQDALWNEVTDKLPDNGYLTDLYQINDMDGNCVVME